MIIQYGAGQRQDLLLRQKYDSGEINASEFLNKLFATDEADRKRRKIVDQYERMNNYGR